MKNTKNIALEQSLIQLNKYSHLAPPCIKTVPNNPTRIKTPYIANLLLWVKWFTVKNNEISHSGIHINQNIKNTCPGISTIVQSHPHIVFNSRRPIHTQHLPTIHEINNTMHDVFKDFLEISTKIISIQIANTAIKTKWIKL